MPSLALAKLLGDNDYDCVLQLGVTLTTVDCRCREHLFGAGKQ